MPYDSLSGNFRCENGFVETKCGENWYDHRNPMFRCENNIVEAKCGEGWYNYNAKIEYCSNGIKKTYGSVTDKDGQAYRTVVIGTQTWMAENLNLLVPSRSKSVSEAKRAIYGRLYTWLTAMNIEEKCYGHFYNCTEFSSTDPAIISRDSLCTACTSQIKLEKHQGICPDGWHIPSTVEWDVLMEYVQTDNNENYTRGQYTASVAGKHLKSMSFWNRNSGSEGIDTYGFAALPGGTSDGMGSPSLSGKYGYWWSTEYKQEAWNLRGDAYHLEMVYDFNNARLWSFNMRMYHSVRCLKN
jgi:uncharacterized protein (TIGR02145 family)